jgi:hypothetical protein
VGPKARGLNFGSAVSEDQPRQTSKLTRPSQTNEEEKCVGKADLEERKRSSYVDNNLRGVRGAETSASPIERIFQLADPVMSGVTNKNWVYLLKW